MLGVEVDVQDIHVHLIDLFWVIGFTDNIFEISSIALLLEVV